MNNHEITDQAIKEGKPGYAQMRLQGGLVSWHPLLKIKNIKFKTFTGGPQGWNSTAVAKAKFIDEWAKGKARVTRGAFSAGDIELRARQWHYGHGPHIQRCHRNPQFAKKILELLSQL